MKDIKIWVVAFGKFLVKRYSGKQEAEPVVALPPPVELKVFTFVWSHKVMKGSEVVCETQQIRTKVKAGTKEEAKQKLTQMIRKNTYLFMEEEKVS